VTLHALVRSRMRVCERVCMPARCVVVVFPRLMLRQHARAEYSTSPPILSLQQRRHQFHVVFGIILICVSGGDGPAVCVSMGLSVRHAWYVYTRAC
jgi:hypothetical protein